MHGPTRAFIIDDIVQVPPMNGVIYRFVSAMRYYQGRTDVLFLIGDRGGSHYEKLREINSNLAIFPASWLYEQSGYVCLLDYLRTQHIRLLHVCNAHTMVAHYGYRLARDLSAYLVCDMHDIDLEIIRDLGKSESEAVYSKRLQLDTADVCNLCIVMSNRDYDWLINQGVRHDKLLLVPNGVDGTSVRRFIPNKPKFVFIGNLHYEPNAEAARLISEQLAPRVALQVRNVRFTIIGDYPDSFKVPHNPVVEFLGPITDADQIMASALAGLAPISSGSGMKVKLLSYGRLGLPVIATPKALAGYERHEGLLCAGGLNELSSHVIGLAQDPQRAATLGASLREHFIQRYNWNNLFQIVDGGHMRILKGEVEVPMQDAPKQFRVGVEAIDHAEFNVPIHLTEQRYKEAAESMIDRILVS